MPIFYHVARTDITGVEQFDLQSYPGHVEAGWLYTAAEFKGSININFPKGLSNFGSHFLLNPQRSLKGGTFFGMDEYIIEASLELVRKLRFPERNSRFSSFFACLTLEDARKLREDQFGGVGFIYKVSCKHYFQADMRFLRQALSIVGIEIVAMKYWSGIASPDPFWEILMNGPVKILEKIE